MLRQIPRGNVGKSNGKHRTHLTANRQRAAVRKSRKGWQMPSDTTVYTLHITCDWNPSGRKGSTPWLGSQRTCSGSSCETCTGLCLA